LKLDIGGGAYLDFLFPDRDVSTWDNNDGSIVSLLSYGNNKIMLTGDSTIKTEEIILSKFKDSYLESLILKAGHHGSKTSTGEDFVKTVKPKYALISSGKDNSYGHPHKEVLDILKTFGVEILRTDTSGTIVFTCDKIELCKLR
jgi:competence protein ComEC